MATLPGAHRGPVGLTGRIASGSTVLLAVLAAWAWAPGAPPDEGGTVRLVPVAGPAVAAASGPRVLGVGACSSTACHGGVATLPREASRVLRNEHTTWVQQDPHARAYQALFSERSRRIVRALGGSETSLVEAHEDPRCLACHTTPRSATELAASPALNADGVGCEACHGPAETWLGPHTLTSWQGLDAATKSSRYGLVDTDDLTSRVAVCAGCHVGRRDDPGGFVDRDVDHDLIAAGHPRLAFEMAAFQDNQPRHWTAPPAASAPDHTARTWLVGQLGTAKASLELLARRAGDDRAPWPEFSEYGCYTCHHALADETWRHSGKSSPRSSWGTWPTAILDDLAEGAVGGDAGDRQAVRSALTQVRAAMTGLGRDRAQAALRAEQAATALGRWERGASASPLRPLEIEAYLEAIDGPGAWARVRDWDEAAQRYLGLVPLLQALGREQAEKERLGAIRRRLHFPAGYDSPRGFDPREWPR